MDRNELLKRIEKKEKDIEKINKRISKWGKGLRPEDIAICEPFGNCVYGSAPRGARWNEYHGTAEYQRAQTEYKNYVATHKEDIPYNDEDWNKGPNIQELKSAYIDLGDARNTLAKYQIELEKIDNFDNAEKIKVLWDFLTEWEIKTISWYNRNAELYFELKSNFEEAWFEAKTKWLNNNPKPDETDRAAYRMWDRQLYYYSEEFQKRYYSQVDTLTKNLIRFTGNYDGSGYGAKYRITGYQFDTEQLNKIIVEEKKRKYEDLVNRVTQVTGTIQDVSNLTIGNQNGELNGYVIGEKGKAQVETISAGGYNQNTIVNSKHGQKFHFRVLVKPIK